MDSLEGEKEIIDHIINNLALNLQKIQTKMKKIAYIHPFYPFF